MASPTYATKALVLRRTKLGESDVICTLLAENGSQIRAVAKGARKPTSSFSSRLELGACCDLLVATGKSLDIIKEARLIESNGFIREDIDYLSAASPLFELLDRSVEVGQTNPRLFALSLAALSTLSVTDRDHILSVTAAHLLKTLSLLGFRPSFDICIGCGDLPAEDDRSPWGFSVIDGGVVCPRCRRSYEVVFPDERIIRWSQVLLYSTFDDIRKFEMDNELSLDILRLAQQLIRAHLSFDMKSLQFLFVNARRDDPV